MVDQKPEHPTGIDVPLAGVRCSECGVTPNPPYEVVAEFPDPSMDAPRGELRCIDCYADLLTDLTPLPTKRAKVVAMAMLGYSHDQIEHGIEDHYVNARRELKKARDEYRELRQQTVDPLSSVMEYL